MPIPTITVEDALSEKEIVFVDTRSPAEFALDALPEAINSPIFDNDQRAEVGTLYKEDKKKAFELGKALYEKKISSFIKLSKEFKGKKIVVYCWRGGMRSKTVTELMIKQGIDAYQLEGGYKAFREYIRTHLHSFKPSFTFVVLSGLGGCGKTDLIKKLSPSIDLESMAGHRSSVFGAIGQVPNNQKNFENKLYFELMKYKNEKFVFIEGESHKVGRVFIPQNIFAAMKKGFNIHITASTNTRVERTVQDYFTHGEDVKICEIIKTLKQALSSKVTEELIQAMKKKDYAHVAKVLLTQYYDPKYTHFLKDTIFEAEVCNDDMEKATKEILFIVLNEFSPR